MNVNGSVCSIRGHLKEYVLSEELWGTQSAGCLRSKQEVLLQRSSPSQITFCFFKRVTETKLLVQLNQWNDLTELRVFLSISNPFLRGTVLLKGSSRL